LGTSLPNAFALNAYAGVLGTGLTFSGLAGWAAKAWSTEVGHWLLLLPVRNTPCDRIAGQSVERLAAPSDGIFAVAMTLLVLRALPRKPHTTNTSFGAP
jgi:hypothetical protein